MFMPVPIETCVSRCLEAWLRPSVDSWFACAFGTMATTAALMGW